MGACVHIREYGVVAYRDNPAKRLKLGGLQPFSLWFGIPRPRWKSDARVASGPAFSFSSSTSVLNRGHGESRTKEEHEDEGEHNAVDGHASFFEAPHGKPAPPSNSQPSTARPRSQIPIGVPPGATIAQERPVPPCGAIGRWMLDGCLSGLLAFIFLIFYFFFFSSVRLGGEYEKEQDQEKESGDSAHSIGRKLLIANKPDKHGWMFGAAAFHLPLEISRVAG